MAQGHFEEAGRHFDSEAEQARGLSLYSRMSRALEDGAEAWAAAGQAKEAADRWLRSARSHFAHSQARGTSSAEKLRELHLAARLCRRIDEQAGMDPQDPLWMALGELVAHIEAEREEFEAILALEEARRRALEGGGGESQ